MQSVCVGRWKMSQSVQVIQTVGVVGGVVEQLFVLQSKHTGLRVWLLLIRGCDCELSAGVVWLKPVALVQNASMEKMWHRTHSTPGLNKCSSMQQPWKKSCLTERDNVPFVEMVSVLVMLNFVCFTVIVSTWFITERIKKHFRVQYSAVRQHEELNPPVWPLHWHNASLISWT